MDWVADIRGRCTHQHRAICGWSACPESPEQPRLLPGPEPSLPIDRPSWAVLVRLAGIVTSAALDSATW